MLACIELMSNISWTSFVKKIACMVCMNLQISSEDVVGVVDTTPRLARRELVLEPEDCFGGRSSRLDRRGAKQFKLEGVCVCREELDIVGRKRKRGEITYWIL